MQAADGNLFDDIPSQPRDEVLTELVSMSGVKIERIVSNGHTTSPDVWYDQDWAEWVSIVSGAAAILFDGEIEPRQLKRGDYLLIPRHSRHQVIWTDPAQPTIWLAVHFGDSPAPDHMQRTASAS